jgi:hypothetical protein
MGKQTKPATIAALENSLTRQDAEELYAETPKHKLWDCLWIWMDRTDCADDPSAKIAAIWQMTRKR